MDELKSTFLIERNKDLDEEIAVLSYLIYKQTDQGKQLLQDYVDSFIVYPQIMHNNPQQVAYNIGMQDFIRCMHNYSLKGRDILNKKEEVKDNDR